MTDQEFVFCDIETMKVYTQRLEVLREKVKMFFVQIRNKVKIKSAKIHFEHDDYTEVKIHFYINGKWSFNSEVDSVIQELTHGHINEVKIMIILKQQSPFFKPH